LGASATIDSASMQLLARGLALALKNPVLRKQLLEDLRDSPFPFHKLDLSSYLHGVRGVELVAAAARNLAVSPASLLTSADAALRSGVEIGMPRYGDRMQWNGDASVVVFGFAGIPADLLKRSGTEIGYDVNGAPASVRVSGPGSAPYIAILPWQQPYGNDPEADRARAPKRSGGTIGAQDGSRQPESASRMRAPDSPNRYVVCDSACSGGGGGGSTLGPGYLVLPSGQSWNDCTNFVTWEHVSASCRAELAWAFRPRLIFNSDEACKDREPYYAVQPGQNVGEVEIFYALSYYRDCNNRTGYADGHDGDSEFIVVRATSGGLDSQHWYLENVTLSAHWGTIVDGTWTGSPPAIEFRPYENLTRPKVYVSWGKHANYRDVGSCGRGAANADDCGLNADTGEEFGIVASSDLGMRSFKARDCVTSRLNPTTRPGTECFWAATSPFTGWLGLSAGALTYGELLSQMSF
jgi:hypothetical protein